MNEHPLVDATANHPLDLYPRGNLALKVYDPDAVSAQPYSVKHILNWSGIHYAPYSKQKVKRKYRFFICELDCLALFQSAHSVENGKPLLMTAQIRKLKWKRIAVNTSSKEVNRARKLAIRALYTLGYDIGMVEISIFPRPPRYAVSKIANSFSFSFMHEKYSLCLNRLQKKQDQTSDQPVLGTDVEFVLRHANGKYMMASKFLDKKGKVGYDAIWIRGHRNQHPLVELRPSPDEDPREVIQDLYRCMKKAVRKINHPQIEWLAGGRPLKGYPIGGHIHFSQVSLSARLIRALDNYLTLPLFLLESETSLSRRPKYGFIGDYREQFHGGFEYRTPPSWIVSPTIAKGVMMLAKLIAVHHWDFEWMPLNNYELQNAFYEGNRAAILPVVQELWHIVRRCSTYGDYEQELDQFYELIASGQRWNEYEDVRKAWRLPPYRA